MSARWTSCSMEFLLPPLTSTCGWCRIPEMVSRIRRFCASDLLPPCRQSSAVHRVSIADVNLWPAHLELQQDGRGYMFVLWLLLIVHLNLLMLYSDRGAKTMRVSIEGKSACPPCGYSIRKVSEKFNAGCHFSFATGARTCEVRLWTDDRAA